MIQSINKIFKNARIFMVFLHVYGNAKYLQKPLKNEKSEGKKICYCLFKSQYCQIDSRIRASAAFSM